jgi:SAM-dependent methyltransferase
VTWRLDEFAHAGPEHLDPHYVERFDAKSPTDWSGELATLDAFGIRAGSTVVDLGAGTGSFALAVAPRVARVVAADVSPAMVATMRDRGLEAVHAGFLTYEHEGDPPAAVHTRNALHHLPDFWKAIALDRVARLLPRRGVLLLTDLVYSFDAAEADAVIADWLAGASDDPARGWTAEELAEHVREEHSTFTWLLEPMLERAGFEIRDRWVSDVRTYASYTCVRR